MKAPLMFSKKKGLGSKVFAIAIIAMILVPNFSVFVATVQAQEADTVPSSTESAPALSVSAPDAAIVNSPATPVNTTEVADEHTTVEASPAVIDATSDNPAGSDTSVVTPAETDNSVTPVTTDGDVTPATTNEGTTPTPTNTGGGNQPQAPESQQANVPTGSVTVCNVIADQNGQLVNSSVGLPQGAFSLNLRSRIGTAVPVQTSAPIQEINFYAQSFNANQPISFPAPAQCLTYDHLPFKEYVYSEVTVTSPVQGRWASPLYNDQYTVPFHTIADAFPYSNQLFDNNPNNDQPSQRNENADGIVTLNALHPHRTVVILNRLNVPIPTGGSITVCKSILGPNFEGLSMSNPTTPAGVFSLNVRSVENPLVTRVATFDASHFMTTWPTPPVGPDGFNRIDAQCTKFENVPFGNYTYTEEQISADAGTWTTVGYNDEENLGFIADRYLAPDSHFYPYGQVAPVGSNLPIDANGTNINSDGKISVSAERPNRAIFLLNQFTHYNGPAPVCSNGTELTPAEFIQNRDLGFITYSLGPNVSDPDHIIIDASSTVATFHITNNTGCTIPLGMGSYRVFSQFERQEAYDVVDQVHAGTTTDISVRVPNCMAQIDVFFDHADRVLQDYGTGNDNPYVYPHVPFIFIAGFYFPTTGTWGDLPADYCHHDGPSNTPPTITVLGDNPATVTINTSYTDAGATAFDTEDGDLTSHIVTTGTSTVDVHTLGSYTITYTVTDSGGLTTTATRTVNVVPANNGGGGTPTTHHHGGSSGGKRPTGEVLGAETGPTACFYLRDYLRRDWTNDRTETLKLQYFLKYFENEKDLESTGVFDQATFDAVERFQNKYFNDILKPWGHTAPTGFVYILTKKKVNEIFCNSPFPVTSAQQGEIDAFRAFLQSHGIQQGSMSSEDSMMHEDNMNIDNMVGVGTSTSVASNIGKVLKDKIDTKNLKAVAAAIFSVPKDRETILQSIYFLLIAIIAIYLFTEIIIGSRDTSKLTKYQVWSRKVTGYLIGLILAIIAAIWYQVFSIVVPFLVLAIVSGAFLAWTLTKKSGNEVINLPPTNR